MGGAESTIAPRDWTIDQLRDYNGTEEEKPYLVFVKKVVFDVTADKELYGPGGSLHSYLGRDASRAFAKKSTDPADLDNRDLSDLSDEEKAELDRVLKSFREEKMYPEVGTVSVPPEIRDFKRDELAAFKGEGKVPKGRIDPPIYLGVGGHVFDVSYGGKASYGIGGGYNCFAGIDASRALAKMSFNEEDLVNPDISDLTDMEKDALQDWVDKFRDIKKYPIIGRIVD